MGSGTLSIFLFSILFMVGVVILRNYAQKKLSPKYFSAISLAVLCFIAGTLTQRFTENFFSQTIVIQILTIAMGLLLIIALVKKIAVLAK